MSKKRKVIEEVKIPWYQKVKKSTWIMAAIIAAIVLAGAGIIIYDQLDTYTKMDYDKVIKVGKYEGIKGTLTKVKVTDEELKLLTTDQFQANIIFKNMSGDELKPYPKNLSMMDLYHLALDYSDGVMFTPGTYNEELHRYAEEHGLPVFGPVDITDRSNGTDVVNFFDSVWSEGKVEEPAKDF